VGYVEGSSGLETVIERVTQLLDVKLYAGLKGVDRSQCEEIAVQTDPLAMGFVVFCAK
jgi:hypothetical protein